MTVDVADFLTKMREDLGIYTETYQKTIKAYQQKHTEYNDYLKKKLVDFTNESVERLKSPPFMPRWDGKRFSDTINALSAHTSKTIIMTASEYNSTVEAVHQASIDIGTAFASMVSTDYSS